MNYKEQLQALSQRYQLDSGLIDSLFRALQLSGGRQVQFNHPELGGMGQWMPGMVMIGDMFNNALKARVDQLCTELAALAKAAPALSPEPADRATDFFPGQSPALSGKQNDMEYAWYPLAARLVVVQQGQRQLYDTSGYVLTGVMQQQQPHSRELLFSTASGVVSLASFKIVS